MIYMCKKNWIKKNPNHNNIIYQLIIIKEKLNGQEINKKQKKKEDKEN